MGRRRKRQMNKHHIRARSTFPCGTPRWVMDYNNIVELDKTFHQCLHEVFGNMPPQLYGEFLAIVLTPNTRWNRRKLEALRQQLMEGE